MLALTRKTAAFIRTARVAHLGTVDEQGGPHVVPICFVFDGKALYSPIDQKPKKSSPLALKRVRNIRANPRVAVVIDRYDEEWERLAFVLLSGKARLLQSGAAHRAAVSLLRRKYPQYRAMAIDTRPIIQVLPERAVCWGSINSTAPPSRR